MLKLFVLGLCLIALFYQALTVAIDPADGEIGPDVRNVSERLDDQVFNFYFASDADLNETLEDAGAVPKYVALFTNDKVYYVVPIQLNWHSAAEFCSSQNLALASINSAEDNQNLVQKLAQSGVLYSGASFWVGGSDIGHNGRWAWLGNGRPFNYQNWLPGQPDNFRGIEHCLELRSDGKWNDLRCEDSIYVICESRCG